MSFTFFYNVLYMNATKSKVCFNMSTPEILRQISSERRELIIKMTFKNEGSFHSKLVIIRYHAHAITLVFSSLMCFNSFSARGYADKLINAIGLGQNQARQNIQADLDPNSLILFSKQSKTSYEGILEYPTSKSVYFLITWHS